MGLEDLEVTGVSMDGGGDMGGIEDSKELDLQMQEGMDQRRRRKHCHLRKC